MENNKNKKSVKFQRDMLNFCDFIQVFVFTRNHHLKDNFKAIIGRNFDPQYYILSFSAIGSFAHKSLRRRYLSVFTICGRCCHLVRETKINRRNCCSPIPWRFHMKVDFNRWFRRIRCLKMLMARQWRP